MAFEGRLTDDLVRILLAGGGVRLAAGGRLTDDLIRMALAAKASGATLTLVGMSGRLTTDLIRIASAGKGRVSFE